MTQPDTFQIVQDTSLLVIAARSSVGGITWSTRSLEGDLRLRVQDGLIAADVPVQATISVALDTLTSGNAAYDAELGRRIDLRRFPRATIGLDRVVPSGEAGRYVLAGTLAFHDRKQAVDGVVQLESATPDRIVVSGEQEIDIRDFGIATPTVLRMRIYPDVRLRLLLEAERVPA